MRKINSAGDVSQGADAAVARRLAVLIQGVQLDCECRARLDQALARFEVLESRRATHHHLASARRHRERIESILFFLQDIDAITAAESDGSVYVELALLFDDIAAAGKEGANAMRQLFSCSAQRQVEP